MRGPRTLTALLILVYIGRPVPAATRGPDGILDFAHVHAAVHEVVQAFEHRFEPYCASLETVSDSSSGAVAKTARDLLGALCPTLTIEGKAVLATIKFRTYERFSIRFAPMPNSVVIPSSSNRRFI
jgi:hypothetical protein